MYLDIILFKKIVMDSLCRLYFEKKK